jgi:hypothetical protein
LRTLAERAKEIAKEGMLPSDEKRNALGNFIAPRGGAPLAIRGRWNEEPGDARHSGFDRRVLAWAQDFHAERLSDRAGYQLRRLATEFAELPPALLAETEHLIEKSSQQSQILARAQAFLKCDAGRAALLADEWIAARWLQRRPFYPSPTHEPQGSATA